MIDWLVDSDPRVLTAAQILASTFLTIMALIVSVVALGVNYRNSRGWQPILMVRGHRYVELKKGITLGTSLELWNRHRYPIVLRKIQVRLQHVRVSDIKEVSRIPIKPGWSVGHGGTRMERYDEEVIGPNEHVGFEVDALCIQEGEFVDDPGMTVHALIYDPVANRHKVLVQKARPWGNSPAISKLD